MFTGNLYLFCKGEGKMKKKRSRIGAVVMAAALALTMGQSVTLYAEENPAGDVSQETQQIVSDEGSGNDLQNEDQATEADGSETNAGADEQDVQTQAVEEDSETADVQDVEGSDVEPSDDTAGTEDETKDSSSENTEVSDNTNMDVNKPVIERVEFDQQGQTLKGGDTVTFRVFAYDADSKIESVNIELVYMIRGDSRTHEDITAEYDETAGCYVGSMKLGNVGTGQVTVSEIRVVDSNSNYVDYTTPNEFWFETEGDIGDVQVEEFNFPINGQTISDDDLFTELDNTWIKLNKEISDEAIDLEFIEEDTGIKMTVSYFWNPDNQRYEVGGLSYPQSEDNQDPDAELMLSSVIIDRFGGSVSVPMDGKENYSVTVKFTEGAEEPTIDAKITSINLDKNGEIVRAGEEVKITVAISGSEKMAENAYAYFRAAADIVDDIQPVDLTYDEEEQAYTGVLTVGEDTYPCEWYLNGLDIYTADYNQMSIRDFYPNLSSTYPWYFNVYSGDTFVTDAQDTQIAFYRQDKYGNWIADWDVSVEKENLGRRFSLSELGISLPELKSAVEGMNQTGWEDQDGNPIMEDSMILNDYGYVAIYAAYDQNRYRVDYNYVASDNTVKDTQSVITLEDGATVGDYREKALEYMPDDMTESYDFTGWAGSNMWSEDSMPLYRDFWEVYDAGYAGKTVSVLSINYADKDGGYGHEDIPLVLDSSASFDDVQAYVDNMDDPEVYPGLRFSEWEVTPVEQLGDYTYVYVNASYENSLIRYIIQTQEEFEQGIRGQVFCQVAEIGDTVTVPTSFEGFTDVEWRYAPTDEDTFVVDSDLIEFSGIGTPTGSSETPEEPDTPVDPGTPEDPDTPADPGTPGNPGTTPEEPEQLPTEEVNTVVEEIKNATAGQTVTVDMGSATVVSKDILEAAKGKDVDIVLDMGGYTWTINGKDIVASNLSDINLEVTMGTTNIPNNLVSALAQGRPVQQISLTHNGDFGFRASLTLNVGSQYAGQYGNLYYYDSDGRMVFMNAGAIGENGNVTLSFSHASDYAIVISDEELSQADADRANSQVHASADSGKPEEAKVQEVSVQTGDNANVLPIVMILIVSAAVVAGCVVIIRRNRIKR